VFVYISIIPSMPLIVISKYTEVLSDYQKNQNRG
jgi:hypothetical protein